MKNKLLVGLSIFLLFFISLSLIFFVRANRPMAKAEKEAIGIAQKQTAMVTPDKFYAYNRDDSYYTVAGRDKDNQQMFVVVHKNGDPLTIVKQEDGLTELEAMKVVRQEADPYKMTRINFGLLDDSPIWEIVTEEKNGALSYYSVSFEDGTIVKTIKNV